MNYELGYRMGLERFNLELIGYYFKLQETITTYTNSNGVVLFQNAGATDQKGVEASIDYAFLRNGKGFIRDFLVGTAYTGQFFTYYLPKRLFPGQSSGRLVEVHGGLGAGDFCWARQPA